MNFDTKLERIRREYGLYFSEADINFVNNREDRIEESINRLFRNKLYGKKIAIRCAGQATKELLEILEHVMGNVSEKVMCIIDKYQNGKTIYNIPVISPDEVDRYHIDVIVLNSFRYRAEINLEYSETNDIEIIDIYDVFAEDGMFFDGEFFQPTDLRTFYLTINFYKNQFEMCENDDKKKFLKLLISCYLSIRDFENAFIYLNKYEVLYDNRFVNACDEIYALLNELKYELNENDKEHIIILWLDQLRYKDIEQMTFLKKYADERILFKNCYTQNLQTSTTFKMMFSGRDVIDGQAYKIDKINENNSILYTNIRKHEYDFKYIGWGKNNVYFDGISSYSLEKDNCILPLTIWKMFMDILNNGSKSVYLAHSFEAHEHHFCGYMEQGLYNVWNSSFEQFVHRYKECVAYIDQQLEFYLPYFNLKWSKIIMSDHGQELENVYKFDENVNYNKEKYKYGRWSEDSLHTVMIVENQNFEKRNIEGMFSLVQFNEIMDSLFCKEWKVKEHDFIKIQSMPFYSKLGLEKIIACHDYKFAMLVKGIISRKYKYLRYASGEEEFYINGNDDDNIIIAAREKGIVDEYRRLCGEIDYSLFEEDKYSGAREMLDEYIVEKKKIN